MVSEPIVFLSDSSLLIPPPFQSTAPPTQTIHDPRSIWVAHLYKGSRKESGIHGGYRKDAHIHRGMACLAQFYPIFFSNQDRTRRIIFASLWRLFCCHWHHLSCWWHICLVSDVICNSWRLYWSNRQMANQLSRLQIDSEQKLTAVSVVQSTATMVLKALLSFPCNKKLQKK